MSLTPAGRRLIEKDLGASLADATELDDEFPIVQKTVTPLRDIFLRTTQAELEKRRTYATTVNLYPPISGLPFSHPLLG